MAQQPTLTVSAAVEAFDIERRTLQKMLSEDRLPGAYKDSRGRWVVPIAALHQTGIPARKTWISDVNTFANDDAVNPHEVNGSGANRFANDANADANADANDLRAHVALLQVQLDAEKEKNEQLRDNLADVRRAMLMLEAATPMQAPQHVEEPQAETEPAPRRSWWQKRKKS